MIASPSIFPPPGFFPDQSLDDSTLIWAQEPTLESVN